MAQPAGVCVSAGASSGDDFRPPPASRPDWPLGGARCSRGGEQKGSSVTLFTHAQVALAWCTDFGQTTSSHPRSHVSARTHIEMERPGGRANISARTLARSPACLPVCLPANQFICQLIWPTRNWKRLSEAAGALRWSGERGNFSVSAPTPRRSQPDGRSIGLQLLALLRQLPQLPPPPPPPPLRAAPFPSASPAEWLVADAAAQVAAAANCQSCSFQR